MPSFLVPRHVSAHRISAIALYRALIQQSRAVPLPAVSRNELQNIIRNRFKQVIHFHSYQRLRLAFQAGYEAVDHLDASVAGDEKSTMYISELVERAPTKVKADPPKTVLSTGRRKNKGNNELGKAAVDNTTSMFKPSTELLSRPHLLSEISGKRHVPVLFSANQIPVLRIKKPQPENLSGFIKHRVKTRQRRHDRRHWLTQQIEFAEYEDLWDSIVERQTGVGDVERRRRAQEPLWVDEFEIARLEVENKLRKEGDKNAAMAARMQEIVDRERECFVRERRELRQAKKAERAERRRVRGDEVTEGKGV